MIKKLTLFIFIVFSLINCGYSPMYSDNSNKNFEIYDLELEGNNEVNNIIKNKLEKYNNNNSEKKYIVKIKTYYKKISATKNSTGRTTHFKLVVDLSLSYKRFGLDEDKQEKEISFSESLIIKKNQNNFEQNDYEKIVIKNMSELLINKVILYLGRS
tara:strand:- start:256 stop:726 length:471 start_codon:yes stop_codon:yes gene_type:complete